MNRFFRWLGLPGRLTLTLLISSYALILALLDPVPVRFIAASAMLLSSLGDIVLMDFKPITRRIHICGFVAGALVFMLSHLTYASAFGYDILRRGLGFLNHGITLAAIVFALTASALLLGGRFKEYEGRSCLIPALLYLLIISFNAAVISSRAFSLGGRALIPAIGIFLFLVSDCFVIARRVVGIRSKIMNELIWWFYPIGQIMIISGI